MLMWGKGLRMTGRGLFPMNSEYVKGATPVLVVSLWLDRSSRLTHTVNLCKDILV